MSSELGSAVTPGGHQRLEGLLNREMATRQLNEQAASRLSNENMLRQQMDLRREENAQAMREAELQRQHTLELQGLSQGFQSREAELARRGNINLTERAAKLQADEAQRHRDWEQQRDQIQSRRELELAKIQADANDAAAQKQTGRAQQLNAQADQLRNLIAKNASAIAIAKASEGKTQSQIDTVLGQMTTALTQKQAALQHVTDMVKGNHATYDGIVRQRGLAASSKALDDLNNQVGMVNWTLTPNLAKLRDALQGENLWGAQYLDLQVPSMATVQGGWSWMTGMGDEATGHFVQGVKGQEALRKTVMGEFSNDIMDLADKMNVPIKDRKAWQGAVSAALAGGTDQATLAQMFDQAGVDPNMFHEICKYAAQTDMASNEDTLLKRIHDERVANGNRDTLRSHMYQGVLEANKVRASMARNAMGSLRLTGSRELQVALDALKAHKAGTPFDIAGTRGLFEQAGADSGSVGSLVDSASRLQHARDAGDVATREQGDLLERLNATNTQIGNLPFEAQAAQTGVVSQGLQGLLNTYPPRTPPAAVPGAPRRTP